MLEVSSIAGLQEAIYSLKQKGKTIGFVPTMGALHNGHLSLIKKSKDKSDITVCSIYVNPTQFNNIEDFNNYPSTLEKDKSILNEANCDILFTPLTEELYPKENEQCFDFGTLETVMEGAHRPGHFNGVATIVSKFFTIVKPDFAFFGQKDYQQLAIIKQMVKDLSFEIKIIPCPTFREESGLAMSSRNQRLNTDELIEASKIQESLQIAKSRINQNTPIDDIKTEINGFYDNSELKLEYFEISDSENLQAVINYDNHANIVICVAAFLGNVRLIDNIVL